jgi:hypothetical protein
VPTIETLLSGFHSDGDEKKIQNARIEDPLG